MPTTGTATDAELSRAAGEAALGLPWAHGSTVTGVGESCERPEADGGYAADQVQVVSKASQTTSMRCQYQTASSKASDCTGVEVASKPNADVSRMVAAPTTTWEP